MGETTHIEWTDATWNPWHGCAKVSPGCAHCYMFRDKKRFGQDPSVVVRSSDSTFRAPIRWHEPRRVFTCSWSDFFIDDADAWRNDAWSIIRETPWHTYQILTKRPERIARHLPWRSRPWENVWLLISAEDQRHFDERWSHLERVPAAIRGVSAEPLLGPIDMSRALASGKLHWVIVGGESGPRARPMSETWVRSIREQCQAHGVPFFFKQWGGVFKKRAGRILDGTTWNGFPALLSGVTSEPLAVPEPSPRSGLAHHLTISGQRGRQGKAERHSG